MINNLLIRLASLTMQRVLILSLVLAALYFFVGFNDGSSIDTQL